MVYVKDEINFNVVSVLFFLLFFIVGHIVIMYASSRAKHSTIPTHRGKKANPCIDFLMVIMASGIARGRVRTTILLLTG